MLSRSASVLRSSLLGGGSRLLRRPAASQFKTTKQRRNMGGGGAYMETNKFGTRLGEAFGTVVWLWIFYRFSLDGKVLLGYEHPWDHGHHGSDHHDDHGHGGDHKPASSTDQWDTVAATFIKPGEDDDEDDEDEDDDDDE